LIVDAGPVPVELLSTAFFTTLAEDSFDFVVIKEVDLVNILASKIKLMFLIHQLDLVWKTMSAHLLGIPKVDSC
jgi:hypothetical protein